MRENAVIARVNKKSDIENAYVHAEDKQTERKVPPSRPAAFYQYRNSNNRRK